MKKFLTFAFLITVFAIMGTLTGCATKTIVERPVIYIIPPTPSLPVDELTEQSSYKEIAEAYAQSIGICRAYFTSIDKAIGVNKNE